jgi:putative photosynthetic complex assembly protein 2
MPSVTLPVLYTATLWWSTTGLILYLNRLPASTFARSLALATAVLAAALATLHASASTLTVESAYQAFCATILVWGWVEMTFLMGLVTGPRRRACTAGCAGLPHLGHAIQAILYHELAIIVCACILYGLSAGSANPLGFKAFVILWAMRQSAKLNLFFGVPNVGEQYLPGHIRYLASFFRRRAMNLLFPVSITLGTLACAYYVRAAAAEASPASAAADSMLATLTGLGVLEHWFLVLPLPSEQLWRWALRRSSPLPSEHAALAPAWVRPSWDDHA